MPANLTNRFRPQGHSIRRVVGGGDLEYDEQVDRSAKNDGRLVGAEYFERIQQRRI